VRSVQMYRESQGRTIEEVALELGISAEPFHKWVRQDEADRGERSDRPISTDQMELRRLRRENIELRRTNEILKLATRYAGDLEPGWRARWGCP
jgi:transposase